MAASWTARFVLCADWDTARGWWAWQRLINRLGFFLHVSQPEKAESAGKRRKTSPMADWKQKCDSEWQLTAKGVPLPDDVDWKTVYEKKPLGRNLLKNPSPHGMAVTSPNSVRDRVKSALMCLHCFITSVEFEELNYSDCILWEMTANLSV